jgi:hypothetical protein
VSLRIVRRATMHLAGHGSDDPFDAVFDLDTASSCEPSLGQRLRKNEIRARFVIIVLIDVAKPNKKRISGVSVVNISAG